jgi:DNA-binding MarR family transcriptional regulator
MVRHEEELLQYLEMVAGATPRLEPAPTAAAALPLFLRQQFDFAATELFGRRVFLAVEKTPPQELSASEYARTVARLKQALGEDVALVMAKLPSYVRNRLVQRGVPFIVPGAQMFLPMLMVDLRERFAAGVSRIPDKLLPAAQLVVIYQILREPAEPIALAQLGERLAYSPQSMSSAQEDLQEAGLCKVRRAGRMIYLEFGLRGRALWEKAEPMMASPVRRKRWVRWGQSRARAVAAGTTALSRMSMLAEDAFATYAMRDREFTAALKNGQLLGCNGREEADARMESWKYDPWVLAEDGVADRCSLYLSLRESGDERVRKEIRSLIEGLRE